MVELWSDVSFNPGGGPEKHREVAPKAAQVSGGLLWMKLSVRITRIKSRLVGIENLYKYLKTVLTL
jgi:hypothetical protein